MTKKQQKRPSFHVDDRLKAAAKKAAEAFEEEENELKKQQTVEELIDSKT